MPFTKGHRVNIGRKQSQETIRKRSLANTGKHPSPETLERLRISHLGFRPTEETRRKLSKNNSRYWLGKHHSEESLEKMRKASSLRVPSEDELRRRSASMIGKNAGSRGWNWKGGLTPIYKTIRQSVDFDIWRNAVFTRDNYTCQKTGVRGGKLHPHHILNFSQYPELRFAIDNGITLSEKSHREFHKKYGQTGNTKEQLEEFLIR